MGERWAVRLKNGRYLSGFGTTDERLLRGTWMDRNEAVQARDARQPHEEAVLVHITSKPKAPPSPPETVPRCIRCGVPATIAGERCVSCDRLWRADPGDCIFSAWAAANPVKPASPPVGERSLGQVCAESFHCGTNDDMWPWRAWQAGAPAENNWDRAASAVAIEVRKGSAAEIVRLRRALERIEGMRSVDSPAPLFCEMRRIARAALQEKAGETSQSKGG
jgi:hypothetical protein